MPLARQLLLKMRLWELLPFLVPFIFLWGIQEPELAEGFLTRACRKYKLKCYYKDTSECSRHRDCPNKQKCCWFACGKKCMDLNIDVCSLPQDPGPCLAYFPRWWYNKETGVCTEFIYGGCHGNLNNFGSESVCTSIFKK
ncbi:WAP four-disulfide core domain protein 6A-like [Arvicola amphibius]|uniref:WAP four-disulfide core domain protein 6A-like n=1 Tax=Arvicola amphibius TaxID=1047088 RepID=UPI0018E2CD7C|nr:WAP four-disulfide core domain protein 6A-like [Arvicola amphibius]